MQTALILNIRYFEVSVPLLLKTHSSATPQLDRSTEKVAHPLDMVTTLQPIQSRPELSSAGRLDRRTLRLRAGILSPSDTLLHLGPGGWLGLGLGLGAFIHRLGMKQTRLPRAGLWGVAFSQVHHPGDCDRDRGHLPRPVAGLTQALLETRAAGARPGVASSTRRPCRSKRCAEARTQRRKSLCNHCSKLSKLLN